MAYVILPALLLTLFAVLIAPYFAHAAEECKAGFCPLASVDNSPKLRALYDSDQNLVTYINSLFKIAISVGAIIAVIRLGIAGYAYMGGDMWHTKQKAKEIITDVFFGLLLLLSIWIILYQINPNLLNLNIAFPGAVAAPPPSAAFPRPSAPRNQAALDKILEDEDVKRATLRGSGIRINKNPCYKVTDTECTNVGLLGVSAVTGLQNLYRDCRCSVVVSGGTEWFRHGKNTAHGPNSPVVDILKDKEDKGGLDRYIRTNGTITGRDSLGRAIYSLGEGRFLDEDSAHWHVMF